MESSAWNPWGSEALTVGIEVHWLDGAIGHEALCQHDFQNDDGNKAHCFHLQGGQGTFMSIASKICFSGIGNVELEVEWPTACHKGSWPVPAEIG